MKYQRLVRHQLLKKSGIKIRICVEYSVPLSIHQIIPIEKECCFIYLVKKLLYMNTLKRPFLGKNSKTNNFLPDIIHPGLVGFFKRDQVRHPGSYAC